MTQTLSLQEFAARVRCLEGEIADEKGEFTLFVVIKTDAFASPYEFELLVSAPWFGADKWETWRFFNDRIRQRWGPEAPIPRVTPLQSSGVRVRGITQSLPEIVHGHLELSTWTVFTNVEEEAVRYAVVITSRRDHEAALLRD
jgi:hypothetical protein